MSDDDRLVGQREKRYGMEPGDLLWMAGQFDDRCWICQFPESVENRRLAVDHDHVTGQVRGLLCTRCNQVLGRMHDNPALLRKAAEYLELARSAFSDGCQECMSAEDKPEKWMYAPAAIVHSDGTRTIFGYVCDQGHHWTCNWRTRGTPSAWSY